MNRLLALFMALGLAAAAQAKVPDKVSTLKTANTGTVLYAIMMTVSANGTAADPLLVPLKVLPDGTLVISIGGATGGIISASMIADSHVHGLYTATSTGSVICGIGFKRITLTATLTGGAGSVTMYLDASNSTVAPSLTDAGGWITLTANGVPMVVTGAGAGGIPPNSITTPGGYRWYRARVENLNCTSVTWHVYLEQ